jgi:hypothetical protein
LDCCRPDVIGTRRPPCRQEHRGIGWPAEPTSWVLAGLQAAGSSPGVLDVVGDAGDFLVGGHKKTAYAVIPAIVARRGGAGLVFPPRPGARRGSIPGSG